MPSDNLTISLIPFSDFQRIERSRIKRFDKLQIIADMCRLNTLSAVKLAGSGHLGSSFSSMDILVALYFNELNTADIGIENPERDIFFSSKGHDVPAHYNVLAAKGIVPFDKLKKLRRLHGLDGHPDIKIPGIEINSGSLGMGISKGKGMAFAKNLNGHGGRIFILTGDGELGEGQIWEALQTTASQKINNVNVIVDFNKIQTDRPVRDIIDLGDLENKFRLFGWHVERCDGHSFIELEEVFAGLRKINNKPKIVIADTIKGKGISFMEGPTALRDGKGVYRWHSGAPDDASYKKGFKEILDRLNQSMKNFKLEPLHLVMAETREKHRKRLKDTAERVVDAFGNALAELGEKRRDIVVLDADLACDCGLSLFQKKYPERFIENGIAEQDMVSMAGGLALQGLLPIVNSFGAFLASRANEQIYANATEGTKIIYACHYAGLIPAGPGKSHQSLRDVSLLKALPNCTILESCNALETKLALNWCVNEAEENCVMRLIISPSPRTISLPDKYRFVFGKGTVLRDGRDAVLFAYGPVMLNEALKAGELLEKKKISLKIINMPWLNRVEKNWIEKIAGNCRLFIVLDDHSKVGSLGDSLLNTFINSKKLRSKSFYKFGINGYPACGTPDEVLRYHQLDGESLAERIVKILKK